MVRVDKILDNTQQVLSNHSSAQDQLNNMGTMIGCLVEMELIQ